MNRSDLAELERIDHEADVAVPGKPDAMRLVSRFVTCPALVRMTAGIQDGRQPLARCDLGRPIEVARHVASLTK